MTDLALGCSFSAWWETRRSSVPPRQKRTRTRLSPAWFCPLLGFVVIQKHSSWSAVSAPWSWKGNHGRIRKWYKAQSNSQTEKEREREVLELSLMDALLIAPELCSHHETPQEKDNMLSLSLKALHETFRLQSPAVPYIPQHFLVRHGKAESVFIAWQWCPVKLSLLLHFQQGVWFTVLWGSKKEEDEC